MKFFSSACHTSWPVMWPVSSEKWCLSEWFFKNLSSLFDYLLKEIECSSLIKLTWPTKAVSHLGPRRHSVGPPFCWEGAKVWTLWGSLSAGVRNITLKYMPVMFAHENLAGWTTVFGCFAALVSLHIYPDPSCQVTTFMFYSQHAMILYVHKVVHSLMYILLLYL